MSLQVVAGSKGPQLADLELEIDGEVRDVQARGNGPVDACFNAIKKLFPHNARLQLYQVHAVTAGTDAQAEVTVRLEEERQDSQRQGADADTLVASRKGLCARAQQAVGEARADGAAGAAADMETRKEVRKGVGLGAEQRREPGEYLRARDHAVRWSLRLEF